jgi:general secretion pathway protein K
VTDKQHRGIALVAVLWFLAVLTILATAVSAVSVNERRTVQRYIEVERANAIADSGIRLAMLELGVSAAGSPVSLALGQAQQFTIFDQVAIVHEEAEAGRVDLNAVDERHLRGVFVAAGWSEVSAAGMAARIIMWREPAFRVINGPAVDDHSIVAPDPLARHAPFETVGELRQMEGASSISGELLDAFTVYSHRAQPDVALAPALVKRAYLASPSQVETSFTAEATQVSVPSVSAQNASGEAFRIRSCVTNPPKVTCRLAIVRLTGNSISPWQVLWWGNSEL